MAAIFYQALSFIFVGAAVRFYGHWAKSGKRKFLVAAWILTILSIDAGWRLFESAVVLPFPFVIPILGLAGIFIFSMTAWRTWDKLAEKDSFRSLNE
ncbi:MAG: hypothetical protein AAF939_09265 [Planctomycetota bacterium]